METTRNKMTGNNLQQIVISISLCAVVVILIVGLRTTSQPAAAAPPQQDPGNFVVLPDNPGQRDHPRIEIDVAGGMHTVYADQASGVVVYAYCAGDCNLRDNWSSTQIAGTPDGYSYDQLDQGVVTALELTPSGAPRVSFVHIFLTEANPLYSYAQCDTNCLQPTNWQVVNLLQSRVDDYGALAASRWFALTDEGMPRMVIPRLQDTDEVIYDLKQTAYLYCNAACGTVDNWFFNVVDGVRVITSINTPIYSLDITSDGRPVFLLADQDLRPEDDHPTHPPEWGNHLTYYECLRDCESDNPVYNSGIIFDLSEWPITQFLLRLDNRDRPRIAAFGVWFELGNPDTAEIATGHCDGRCSNLENWQWRRISQPGDEGTGYGFGVDLDFDANNVPLMSFYADNPAINEVNGWQHLQLARCIANCDSFGDIVWVRETIFDLANVDEPPRPYENICLSMGWGASTRTDLGISPTGNVAVVYGTGHGHACGGRLGEYYNYETGQWESEYTGDIFRVKVTFLSSGG